MTLQLQQFEFHKSTSIWSSWHYNSISSSCAYDITTSNCAHDITTPTVRVSQIYFSMVLLTLQLQQYELLSSTELEQFEFHQSTTVRSSWHYISNSSSCARQHNSNSSSFTNLPLWGPPVLTTPTVRVSQIYFSMVLLTQHFQQFELCSWHYNSNSSSCSPQHNSNSSSFTNLPLYGHADTTTPTVRVVLLNRTLTVRVSPIYLCEVLLTLQLQQFEFHKSTSIWSSWHNVSNSSSCAHDITLFTTPTVRVSQIYFPMVVLTLQL